MTQKENQTRSEKTSSADWRAQQTPNANCPFCSILRKGTSAFEVFRDEISVSFLDRRPVFLGHCLLIPLGHFETLYDLPKKLVGPFFLNAQLVGMGVQTAMGADGTLILINNKVSQSVPHLHIHIIPRRVGDHLRGFMWPRLKYESEDQMAKIASSISIAISEVSRSTLN